MLLVTSHSKGLEDNRGQSVNRALPLLRKDLTFWLILYFCSPGNPDKGNMSTVARQRC